MVIKRAISFYFSLSVILVIVVENRGEDKYEFIQVEKYESARRLDHEDTQRIQELWKVDIDEYKSACYEAKRKTKIKDFVFSPYYYKPEIHEYEFTNLLVEPEKPKRRSRGYGYSRYDSDEDYQDEDDSKPKEERTAEFGTFAMYCGTLPSVYVQIAVSQSGDSSKKFMKAISIKSPTTELFVRQKGTRPNAVPQEKYVAEEFANNPLMKMNLEDRRGLCATAMTGKQFHFFGNHVPEARVYEFQYSGKASNEITAGILCPVVPTALIHQKDDTSPLMWSFIQLPTQGFVFGGIEVITLSRYSKNKSEEKMRSTILSQDYQTGWAFCIEAKKHLPNPDLVKISDKYVGMARLYNFTYHDGSKKEWVAVQCCEDPTMYLRLEDFKKEIKVMFFTSTAKKMNALTGPTKEDL